MAFPFLKEPVDIEAQTLHTSPWGKGWSDPAWSFAILWRLNNILRPHYLLYDTWWTCSQDETFFCAALLSFTNRNFLYNIGDAEHNSKASLSGCQKCDSWSEHLHFYVVPKSQTCTRIIKKIHRIACISQSNHYLVWSFVTWSTNKLI